MNFCELAILNMTEKKYLRHSGYSIKISTPILKPRVEKFTEEFIKISLRN